jgi:hypothetical protein
MKLYKLALIASLLFPSITFAQSGGAGLDTKALDGQQRYAEISIPFIMTSSGSSNSNFAAGMTPSGGVVFTRGGALANIFIPNNATTISTATVGALPYAATVAMYHLNSGMSTPPQCTQIVISGVDQFGNDISENLGTVGVSYVQSNNAFDRITYVVGTGCTYGTGVTTASKLRMIVGRGIGLKRRIRSIKSGQIADILAYCFDPDGGTSTLQMRCVSGLPYSSSNANTLVNGDFQGSGLTTNVAYSTLTIPGTLGAAVTGNGANGSSVVIRLRGNKW